MNNFQFMAEMYTYRVFKISPESALENTKGAIKNGQSRETGNIRYTRHRTNKR